MAVYVGIDFGRGDTEAVLDESLRVQFPSVVARDVDRRYGQLLTPLDANGSVHVRIINDQGERRVDRLVGKTAIEQNPLARAELAQQRDEEDVIALVGEALFKLGVTGPAKLVVGAPIDYYKPIRENGTYRKLLVGQWEINGRSVDVQDVVVLPEAVGTFYSLTLNLDGSVKDFEMMRGSHAVVDVGMFTTDVVWFEDARFIEPRSFSVQFGVHAILSALKSHMLNEHNQDVSYFRLVGPLRDGKAVLAGQEIDFSQIIKNAAEVLAESIISELRSAWRDVMGLRSVHVAGGGAYYTWQHFQKEYGGIAKPVEHAEWANAKGFRAFAEYKFRRNS